MAVEPVVLHVLEALEGGTAHHVVDLARHVPGTHHVAIPTRRIPGLTDETAAPRLRAAGATVHHLEMRRSAVSLANARAFLELRGLVRRIQPDVVHGHSSVGGALARLAAGRVPTVYTPNGLATGRGTMTVERGLGRLTARLIAVSASEADVVRARRLVRAERIAIVPNGIDQEAPPPGPDLRDMLGIPSAAPLVGTVSRLVPQKAPERLAALASTLLESAPTLHVIVIGDGPRRGALDGIAEHPRFHLIPVLELAERVVGQLDVFVLTSRFEGMAYAPLEAMRAGTPVVLTDVVGNRDVVRPGVNGFLVAEDDAGGMARSILDLLEDRDRLDKMGAAAREGAARFDVRAEARAVAELYAAVRLDAG